MNSPIRLDFYDAELRAHHRRLRAAYGIVRGDEVLDVGCGTGLTTREVGRLAAPGTVVGIDISERMVERARELTAADRLENVSYDWATPRCPPSTLSASTWRSVASAPCSSPIRSPASPTSPPPSTPKRGWSCSSGRAASCNDWALAIDAALGDAVELPPPPTADPFSLGDAEATTATLERAGFEAVRFEDVHEPVLYGHDIDAALEFVCGFQDTSSALARMSPTTPPEPWTACARLSRATTATTRAWPSSRAPG